MYSTLALVVCLTFKSASSAHCSNPLSPATNAYDRLWRSLTVNTDTSIRPVVGNGSTPTIVTYESSLRHVMRLVEIEESLEILHVVALSWYDDTLCWRPADFDDIAAVRVPSTLIWMPDVTVYEQCVDFGGNSNVLSHRLEANRSITQEKILARIYSDGRVVVKWPERIKVHCPLSVAQFPWDSQTCRWTATSWAYDGGEVRVMLKNATTEAYEDNSEWRLVSYSGANRTQNFTSGTWFEVVFSLSLSRNAMYYVVTLVLPSFTITTLCVFGMFSPTNARLQREEKVTLGLTALLTMSIILLMVSNMMPKNAANFPLLGTFIIFEMALTSAATSLGVVVMYMHGGQVDEPLRAPPKWLAMMLCMRANRTTAPTTTDDVYKRLNTADSMHIANDNPISSVRLLNEVVNNLHYVTQSVRDDKLAAVNRGQWTKAAFRVDCIAFVIFMLVNFISVVVLLVQK